MHGETSSGLGGDDPDLVVIPAAAVDVERRRGRAVVAPKLVGFFRAVLVVVSSHVSLAKELRFGKFNPRSEDLCRGIATCKWQVDPSGADFARVTYTVDNFVNFTRPIPYETWGMTERVFSMCEHSASLRGAMDTGSWDLYVETSSGLGDEIHQLLVTLEEFDGLTSKSSGSRLVEPCLLREVDIACAQGVSLAKLVPDNPTRYAIVRFRGPHADKTSRTLRDEMVLELPAALKRKMDEKMHDNSGVAGLAKLKKNSIRFECLMQLLSVGISEVRNISRVRWRTLICMSMEQTQMAKVPHFGTRPETHVGRHWIVLEQSWMLLLVFSTGGNSKA